MLFPARQIIGFLLCALLLSAGWAAAQASGTPRGAHPHDAPDGSGSTLTGELTVLGANALLGGVTGGVVQRVRGGSFRDGFTRGLLGGSAVYAGKRLAAASFDGAGLLGREVAAVGSSVVRNAAEGRPALERLILPAGPLRVYWYPGGASRTHAKLDLQTLFWIGYAALDPHLELDGRASLSAGTPVFVAPGRILKWKGSDRPIYGTVPGGLILLSGIPVRGEETIARTLAHERIHVLQFDQLLTTWVDPFEGWLLRRIPGGGVIGRYVNVLTPLAIAPFFFVGEYESRPWEQEAEYLTR